MACGTPMVGQALQRGRYRYYRCRRSYAGFSDDLCDSRYVRAKKLEGIVLEQLVQILSDPNRLLDEARRLDGASGLSSDLAIITDKIGAVEAQQGRLARLYTSGALPEDALTIESERLKYARTRLERERIELENSITGKIDVSRLQKTRPQMLDKLRAWVSSASGDDLTLILNALQVKIKASNEQVHIEGVVPDLPTQFSGREGQDLVTIERTSGCVFTCNK